MSVRSTPAKQRALARRLVLRESRDRNLVFGSRSRTSPSRFGFGAETDFRPALSEFAESPSGCQRRFGLLSLVRARFGLPGGRTGRRSKNGPCPKALWALRRDGRQRLPLPRRASRCRSARRRAPGAADRARRRGSRPRCLRILPMTVLLDEGQNPHLGPAIGAGQRVGLPDLGDEPPPLGRGGRTIRLMALSGAFGLRRARLGARTPRALLEYQP